MISFKGNGLSGEIVILYRDDDQEKDIDIILGRVKKPAQRTRVWLSPEDSDSSNAGQAWPIEEVRQIAQAIDEKYQERV